MSSQSECCKCRSIIVFKAILLCGPCCSGVMHLQYWPVGPRGGQTETAPVLIIPVPYNSLYEVRMKVVLMIVPFLDQLAACLSRSAYVPKVVLPAYMHISEPLFTNHEREVVPAA